MIFAISSWVTPWSTRVYAYDASLEGFSIQSATWDQQQVRAVGLRKEKTRWKLGAEKARQKSLEAAGYLLDENGKLERNGAGGYVKIDASSLSELHSDRWAPDENFVEVPSHLLNPVLWKRVAQGRWYHSDAIHNLEARSLTKTCDRLGDVTHFYNSKVLILGDNLAVTLAFARRRAKDFTLLTQVRRMCSVGLARNLKFVFRWIPSELNVADFDSRNFGDHAPKPIFPNSLPSAPRKPQRINCKDESPKSKTVVRSHFGSNEVSLLGDSFGAERGEASHEAITPHAGGQACELSSKRNSSTNSKCAPLSEGPNLDANEDSGAPRGDIEALHGAAVQELPTGVKEDQVGGLSSHRRGAAYDEGCHVRTKRGTRGGVRLKLRRQRRYGSSFEAGRQGASHCSPRAGSCQARSAVHVGSEAAGPEDMGLDPLVPGDGFDRPWESSSVPCVSRRVVSLWDALNLGSNNGGLDDGHFHERIFSERTASLGRRKGHGSSSPLRAKSGYGEIGDDAAVLTCAEGLAKTLPVFIEASSTLRSVVCPLRSTGALRLVEDGGRHHDPACTLPSSGRALFSSVRGSLTTKRPRSSLLGAVASPSYARKIEQDGFEGRECDLRHSAVDTLAKGPGLLGGASSGSANIGRAVSRVPCPVQKGSTGHRCTSDGSFGGAPLRRLDRDRSQDEDDRGGSEAGPMGKLEEPPSLREGRRAEQRMAEVQRSSAASLSSVRKRIGSGFVGGHHARRDADFQYPGLGSFSDSCRIKCSGKHGWCSFRDRAHIQLEGARMTRKSQRYPWRLSQSIAEVLTRCAKANGKSGCMYDLFGGEWCRSQIL